MADDDLIDDLSEEVQRVQWIGGKEGHGRVSVNITSDEMEAWGDFYPAKEGGKILLADDVYLGLTALGITFGVQEKTVNEGVFECNTSKSILKNILIAKGQRAKKETPPHLQLPKHLFDHSFNPQAKDNALKNVDFKDIKPFVLVKKGELLARTIPPISGEEGMTVTGKALPPGKKEIVFLKPGDKTIYNQGKVLAGITGRFFVDKDVFNVSDVLELEKGVNYSTGHVVFPGDVFIQGIVEDGFRVVAGRNLECADSLDASEVLVGANLTVKGGIIGKTPGLVRVEKNLTAKFIENAQVELLGDLEVTKGILGSRILCQGSLNMPEGRIIQSKVDLLGGAEIGQLGGPAANAIITLGLNFVTERKISRLKELYQDGESRIQAAMNAPSSDLRENEIQTLKEQLIKITQEINKQQQEAVSKEEVSLKVRGEIFPGSEIYIGYVQFKAVQSMKAKEFKLSPQGMVIEISDYKPEH